MRMFLKLTAVLVAVATFLLGPTDAANVGLTTFKNTKKLLRHKTQGSTTKVPDCHRIIDQTSGVIASGSAAQCCSLPRTPALAEAHKNALESTGYGEAPGKCGEMDRSCSKEGLKCYIRKVPDCKDIVDGKSKADHCCHKKGKFYEHAMGGEYLSLSGEDDMNFQMTNDGKCGEAGRSCSKKGLKCWYNTKMDGADGAEANAILLRSNAARLSREQAADKASGY